MEYGIEAVGGSLLVVWSWTDARADETEINRGDFEARSIGMKVVVTSMTEVTFASKTLLHASRNPGSPGLTIDAMAALFTSTSK
jgi:hypothetical protein